MKPLQRFLKPQDIEIIFINIEVSWPVPSPPGLCPVGITYSPTCLWSVGVGSWATQGGRVTHLLLGLLSPGPHPFLRVGPASRTHSLPKGDEGSPGRPRRTHSLPGLHQIQGEVRPGWPAQTPGSHPVLLRQGIWDKLPSETTGQAELFLLCSWVRDCPSLVQFPALPFLGCVVFGNHLNLSVLLLPRLLKSVWHRNVPPRVW